MTTNNSLNAPIPFTVAKGGTGLSTITSHYLIIGNGASNPTLLAPSATSGVPLISQGSSSDPAYGTAVVAGGGSGATSFTAYSVLCGGTTSTGSFQNVSGVGTSGQVLTSNGASSLPTWQTPAAGSFKGFMAYPSADITNVTGDSTNYTLVFNTVTTPLGYNVGSLYNTSTGTFTADADMKVDFTLNLDLTGLSVASTFLQVYLSISGTSAKSYCGVFLQANNVENAGLIQMPYVWGGIPMTNGDTANVHVIAGGSSKVVGIVAADSAFSGRVVG